MSEQTDNVAVMRQYIAAFNSRDLDAYDVLLAPDVTGHYLPPGLPSGAEGVKLFLSAVWAAFDAELTIDDITASDDLVACRWTFAGSHTGDFNGIPATGRSFSLPMMTFDRFVDGLITERWEESDTLDLLKQLGAEPTA
jgi:steroid delta-isomerase-like uncharacterized protein